MFASFRFFTMAMCIAVASNVWGQQVTPTAIPPQQVSSSIAENDKLVKVFSLRNVAAADMQTTLQNLYGGDEGFVVSAQPRTNQLVVVGTPAAIEKVEALLLVLDQNSAEPIVQMLSKESRAAISPTLAQTLAQEAQVDLAFDEELGVMMVRSESEDRVKRFTDVLDRLNTQIQENSKVVEREVLIRVSWLTPHLSTERTGSVTPDPSLKEAIDKLTTMGYTDLTVAGQLMTRCSISSTSANSTSEFQAEGHTAEGFDLGLRGHFMSRGNRGGDSIDVHMSVRVKQATKSENKNDCLLSVVLKMKEGKPIILGSAPVAGAQSFFVVQFMDAE
jgi:hypothetical protein